MKKEHWQRVLYGVFAFLAMLLLWMGANAFLKTDKYPVEVLFLGDSVVGGDRGGTSIPYYVATDLNIRASNAAFGGSSISQLKDKANRYYERDALSLNALVNALIYDDFGPQQMLRIREYATEDFAITIDELSRVDFSQVKTLILVYGTNDYNGFREIENKDDVYDPYTVKGALRSAFSLLREKREDLRIILVSPTYNWFTETGETCEERDYGFGTLEDYVKALEEVAVDYQVEFLDLYHDFYPHESFDDWKIYTFDGIHPNQDGRRKIADRIIEVLQN